MKKKAKKPRREARPRPILLIDCDAPGRLTFHVLDKRRSGRLGSNARFVTVRNPKEIYVSKWAKDILLRECVPECPSAMAEIWVTTKELLCISWDTSPIQIGPIDSFKVDLEEDARKLVRKFTVV